MKYIVPQWETWQTADTIASRFKVTEDQIIRANPVLQSVPVRPGMILDIPGNSADNPAAGATGYETGAAGYETGAAGLETGAPAGGYVEYLAQPDDSLYRIASLFRLDLASVMAQNPQIENPYVIWPGQIIRLVYSES